MKKLFIPILLVLMLCGCERTKPEYLISSMGFDSKNGNITVYLETVIINSENTEQTLKVLKGTGESVNEAVSNIYRQCTQPLLFSHCGLIIIGENISSTQFDDICDYCYSQDELTLSALFITTPNAEKLLSQKPVSSACVGYDIMGLIEQYSKAKKLSLKNRYYQIESGETEISLPKITVKKEGYYFENF